MHVVLKCLFSNNAPLLVVAFLVIMASRVTVISQSTLYYLGGCKGMGNKQVRNRYYTACRTHMLSAGVCV